MTYAELKQAISDWTHRSYEDSVLDLFARMGLQRIARDAPLIESERIATLTFTENKASLPPDCLEIRSLWIQDTNGERPLDYVTPNRYPAYMRNNSGKPYFYTLMNGQIYIGPGLGSATAIYIQRANFPASNNEETLIMGRQEALVLYSCIAEAYRFLQDIEQLNWAETQYQTELERERISADDNRYNGAPLVMRDTQWA